VAAVVVDCYARRVENVGGMGSRMAAIELSVVKSTPFYFSCHIPFTTG
jgi:hypothetical protein